MEEKEKSEKKDSQIPNEVVARKKKVVNLKEKLKFSLMKHCHPKST